MQSYISYIYRVVYIPDIADYKEQYQAYHYNTITMLRFPITGTNEEIKMEILEHKVQILHERMKALEEKGKEKEKEEESIEPSPIASPTEVIHRTRVVKPTKRRRNAFDIPEKTEIIVDKVSPVEAELARAKRLVKMKT